ncbi:MAG: hypothetical protein EBU66_11910 [Bacteroidetes bacterium]|jgi:hypothetical protein|nr:hypothetical protein [bacterium]NBP65347.1 hypothetical protein [Bacteroidota bacterium]
MCNNGPKIAALYRMYGNYSMSRIPIVFNTTNTKVVEHFAFGNLSRDELIDMYRDGRAFSFPSERLVAKDYGLQRIPGCEDHDFIDPTNPDVKYDAKTFTPRGCGFMPSSMKGTGRTFDKALFEEKSKGLHFIIISNVHFPEIKIRFVEGLQLLERYPKGQIPFKDHDAFFQ